MRQAMSLSSHVPPLLFFPVLVPALHVLKRSALSKRIAYTRPLPHRALHVALRRLTFSTCGRHFFSEIHPPSPITVPDIGDISRDQIVSSVHPRVPRVAFNQAQSATSHEGEVSHGLRTPARFIMYRAHVGFLLSR